VTTEPGEREPAELESLSRRMAEFLEPRERLLASAPLDIADGVGPADPADAGPPPPLERPERKHQKVLGFALSIIDPIVTIGWADRLVDRIFFGVAGRGEPGSRSSLVQYGRSRATGMRDTVFAVTDRRLLLCVSRKQRLYSLKHMNAAAAEPLELVAEVPRTEIVSARVGWHRLNPKRLRIDFADGSWLAFTNAIAEPAAPVRRVAAALSGDRPA
jgi:hypothetical protein